ncbi:hypothetical protein NDU88_003990 [Pleurodeles waltl]|uniref:Uncharacterized protein n=1 Tax=Pleurodeles waltl TaxID=8319 RepID=A0AAV7MTV2_PLEWA|nr:hypothetical protein NDU88_003990 [Pleurodeles waltl]
MAPVDQPQLLMIWQLVSDLVPNPVEQQLPKLGSLWPVQVQTEVPPLDYNLESAVAEAAIAELAQSALTSILCISDQAAPSD